MWNKNVPLSYIFIRPAASPRWLAAWPGLARPPGSPAALAWPALPGWLAGLPCPRPPPLLGRTSHNVAICSPGFCSPPRLLLCAHCHSSSGGSPRRRRCLRRPPPRPRRPVCWCAPIAAPPLASPSSGGGRWPASPIPGLPFGCDGRFIASPPASAHRPACCCAPLANPPPTASPGGVDASGTPLPGPGAQSAAVPPLPLLLRPAPSGARSPPGFPSSAVLPARGPGVVAL